MRCLVEQALPALPVDKNKYKDKDIGSDLVFNILSDTDYYS